MVAALALFALCAPLHAETVKVEFEAREVDLPIDNKGTLYRTWTFNGTVPGPVVRVTEGDTVEFTLKNSPDNKNSHSIDFHAARVDVLDEFSDVPAGQSHTFTFEATTPGVFYYHCGADPMYQHIARGMFGVIIVDPKDPNALPKADREYVLVQSEIYPNPDDREQILEGEWEHVVFNGRVFRYDPVHDPNAAQWLQAKPGERVRIYFVNAGPHEYTSFHPIAGIWDRVWLSGNPHNEMRGLQSFTVGPGDGAIFDLISPKAGANVIVNHSMKAAHKGAMAVIMFNDDADPEMGRGDNLVVQ
jgi:nitrite reductase (NO-forming)